jgi:excisionase family DNA binding protein
MTSQLQMLTAKEVAGILRILPQQALRWARSGRLPGVQFGRRWRFRAAEIENVCQKGLLDPGNYINSSKTRRVGGGVRSWREAPTT